MPALAPGDSVSIDPLIVCQAGGGTGRPGVGSSYILLSRFFDDDGTESFNRTDTITVNRVRQNFAGRSDVTEYISPSRASGQLFDTSYTAYLPNGDREFYSERYYDGVLWFPLPIASHGSSSLPPVEKQIDDTTRHTLTGSVRYEGTEQLTVAGSSLLTHRIVFTTTSKTFEKGVLIFTEIETETHWYAPAIDYLVKGERVFESDDYPLTLVLRAELTNYTLK